MNGLCFKIILYHGYKIGYRCDITFAVSLIEWKIMWIHKTLLRHFFFQNCNVIVLYGIHTAIKISHWSLERDDWLFATISEDIYSVFLIIIS